LSRPTKTVPTLLHKGALRRKSVSRRWNVDRPYVAAHLAQVPKNSATINR
jgi:hypothetical protein